MRGNPVSRWLILAGLSFLVIFSLYKVLDSHWDGKSRLSLVIGVQNSKDGSPGALALFSIEPRKNSALYLILPRNLQLRVPYGYQDYIAGNVYQLGQLDRTRRGGWLLSRGFENTFGVYINGYMVGRGETLPLIVENEKNLFQVKSNLFSIFGILLNGGRFLIDFNNIDSNFSLYDRIKLWLEVRRLRGDQITFYNLADNYILEDEKRPDGSVVKNVNTDLFELTLKDSFQDSEIRKENVTLEVVNATSAERVAAGLGRIMNHLGVSVVLSTTAKTPEKEGCLLYVSQPTFRHSAVVDFIIKNFNCTVSNARFENSQTDVKIVLGEDFLK